MAVQPVLPCLVGGSTPATSGLYVDNVRKNTQQISQVQCIIYSVVMDGLCASMVNDSTSGVSALLVVAISRACISPISLCMRSVTDSVDW